MPCGREALDGSRKYRTPGPGGRVRVWGSGFRFNCSIGLRRVG